MGIGTAGYGAPGEIWNDSVAQKAVSEFLSVGGRRIDTAYDYGDQKGIGAAIKASSVPRDEIFITSKIGGGPLGFNETLSQMETILDQFNDSYVDLILIHWLQDHRPSLQRRVNRREGTKMPTVFVEGHGNDFSKGTGSRHWSIQL